MFESLDKFEEKALQNELIHTATPVPSRFYEVQKGMGGLLTTVGRAYKISAGAERLKLAQKVNNHYLNKHLRVKSNTSFNKKYFPDGIISFRPIYTCGLVQRRAKIGEKKCFAKIWIPPKHDVNHSQIGRTMSIPAISTILLAKFSLLNPLFKTKKENMQGIINNDNRVFEDNTTKIPNRWICHITSIFKDEFSPGAFRIVTGTGLQISENHILTAAHLMHDFIVYNLSPTLIIPKIQSDIAVVITPGRNGYFDFPFAQLVVSKRGKKDFFKVHDLWKKNLKGVYKKDLRLDFAVIKFSKRDRLNALDPLQKGFWGNSDTKDTFSVAKNIPKVIKYGLVKTTGYPSDKSCQQWTSESRLKKIQDYNILVHDADFQPGNSGGPVWVERKIKTKGNKLKRINELIGLATSTRPDETNTAVLFRPPVWKFINKFMEQIK